MINENKSVYINVGESGDIRKDVLCLNIDLINLLKKYEYLKEIRNNKQKGFLILRDLLKEINEDFSKLRNDLPAVQPKKEEKARIRIEESKFEVKHMNMKINRELSSLEKEMCKLRMKLREIE